MSETGSGALTGVTAIAAGQMHSCALLSDGTARCWGSNGFEQLGYGVLYTPGSCLNYRATCSSTPVVVKDAPGGSSLTGISSLSADDGYDTCAVMTDASARCWGQNSYMEIGDGTTIDRCVPAAPGSTGPAAAVPPTPLGVAATGGVDKAIVTWTREDGDCGQLQSFTITASPGGQSITIGNNIDHDGLPPTSAEFQLAPGTAYTFRMTANDAVGSSPLSAASNAVNVVGEPGPPTAVTATPANGAVVVKWTASVHPNGSPITGYAITPIRNGAPDSPITFNSKATTETVTGLHNGTAYTFTVAAINAYGVGAQTPPSKVTVAGAPLAPTAVIAAVGTTSAATGPLTVSFTRGATNGAAISFFSVTCSSVTGGVTRQKSAAAGPIVVTGLTTGKAYTCVVQAANRGGSVPHQYRRRRGSSGVLERRPRCRRRGRLREH